MPLPKTMSAQEAMVIGTAGYTAMLAVLALQRHGLTPASGPGRGDRCGRGGGIGRDRDFAHRGFAHVNGPPAGG